MPSKKKKDQNPYGRHTVEEVMQTEKDRYYIQVGDAMFENENGKVAFTIDRAEYFYMMAWEGLKSMRKHGTPEEQDEAVKCLLNFRIISLRFH